MPPSSSGFCPARTRSTARRRAAIRAPGSGLNVCIVDSTSERKYGPQPGHAGELGPVGDLVQGQPQPELTGREPEVLLQGEDVGAHVVDDVLVLGVLVLDDEHVVLAEHPCRHPAQQGTDLGAGEGPADGGGRRRRQTRPDPLAERPQQALERRQVGPDPARTVGDPGPGGAGGRAQPGLLGDQLLGLGGELLEVGAEGGVVVGLGQRLPAGDAYGDALGRVPPDRVQVRGTRAHGAPRSWGTWPPQPSRGTPG